MPGIERLPMWLRQALYWALFSFGITAVGCLVQRESFTAGRLLVVALIVGIVMTAEAAWRRRRDPAV